MKTQTIEFQSFMKNTWREEVKPRRKVNSFIPIPTPSALFSEPVIAFAVGGVILVGLAVWEQKLVRDGKETEAELLSTITGILIPTIAFGCIFYFLFYANPIFFWI